MNIEQLRNYCISKKAVEECFPFDEETLVFKVMGKMFLLTGIDSKPVEFNVKCNPELAIQLREKYSCVKPGFHMSKTHWNTVTCDNSAPSKLLKEWIDHSYEEVVKGLTKKLRQELESL
ncbi:MAG: MmcQ/YjbR family DNA-binding protein [Sphingobacteriaceae bacterium]|nr:MmcQ/YjbR family DNA-binding protein [Sphingobacteriaceae bacterium]